jgi:hypothetical protein
MNNNTTMICIQCENTTSSTEDVIQTEIKYSILNPKLKSIHHIIDDGLE